MALVDLWKDEEARNRKLFQLITYAGSGKLLDGNQTSEELRALLAQVSTDTLARFTDECLTESFPDSGLALQDIVNEAGRRLGYAVKPGPYRGRADHGNQDATWVAPDGWTLIVEVKTTSAYQVQLRKIAEYRERLIREGRATSERSSILIVVGRNTTDDFEAQIRGSRYAWTVRMISTDALVRLLEIGIDEQQALSKIHRIFVPQEYTKVDNIIDLVFETVEASRETLDPDTADPESEDGEELVAGHGADVLSGGATESRRQEHLAHNIKLQCLERVESRLETTLTGTTRSVFTGNDGAVAVMCAISKRYRDGNYWFAFHEYYKPALERAAAGYVALGCGSAQYVLCIPYRRFVELLPRMNESKGERKYWHVHVWHRQERWVVRLRGREQAVDITDFLL